MMHTRLHNLIRRLDRLDRALSRPLAAAGNGSRGLHLVTHLGDSWLWAAVCLLPVGSWQAKGGWGACLGAAALIVLALKHTVRRPRPRTLPGLFSPGIDRFSFPSGHAARLGLLAVWALRHSPRNLAPALIFGLVVGWSRVRLGIHTLGDVLAGYGVGALVGWVGAVMRARLRG